ncbi:unnamed protein product [Callosobruchus maculatus]|uniref:Uncharacterized protein n=1 Tax=Callosobruchus maculatus TaxID=64391 RepID=A0A653BG86_CALMS|nr:unnamed protein product [Callosobruchus maculatus]
MPNSRKRHRSRSYSRDRESLSVVLKRIEHRLGKLEQTRKKRRRSRSSSYSVDSRSNRSSSTDSSGSSNNGDAIDQPLIQSNLDAGNADNALPPEERQENAEPPSDEIISLFTAEGDTKQMFSPSIQPELAACWTKILISGLATETKENLIKKYLPPENCQELSAPLINPEVKRASPENSVRRDARIAQIQQQVGAATSAVSLLITEMLKKEGGANREYIECLNDIGRLLCDVHYNESVSRRELLCLTLNKDFKEALKDTSICKWLFGSDLDSTLKTAKELEKSTQQLKVPKKVFRQPQGNLKRPLVPRKGARQSGQQLRAPNSHQKNYQQTKHSQRQTGKQDRVSDRRYHR